MIGDGDLQDPASREFHLIDFGIAKKYLLENGNHIKLRKMSTFYGNLMFASRNAFYYYNASRRDDIIAIVYTILYLLKGCLPWQLKRAASFKEYYEHVGKMKRMMTPEQLCTGRAAFLLPILQSAYKLRFPDRPDYKRIKKIFYQVFD